MQITTDLRLAFPIRWSDTPDAKGQPVPLVWAYHTPISKDLFEANWRIIAATSTTLLKPGMSSAVLGIAALALKDAGRLDAAEYGVPEGVDAQAGGIATLLLGELRRLTIVLAPGLGGGYETIPVDQAIGRGIIDADDWSEAEASLVFFTCGCSMASRQRKAASALSLASVLRGSITSSGPTEFAASLTASTPDATS